MSLQTLSQRRQAPSSSLACIRSYPACILSSSISKPGMSGNQRCHRDTKHIQIQSPSNASRVVLKAHCSWKDSAISWAESALSQSRPNVVRSRFMPKERSFVSNSPSLNFCALRRSDLPAARLRYSASEAYLCSANLFRATQEIKVMAVPLFATQYPLPPTAPVLRHHIVRVRRIRGDLGQQPTR